MWLSSLSVFFPLCLMPSFGFKPQTRVKSKLKPSGYLIRVYFGHLHGALLRSDYAGHILYGHT